MNFFNNCSKCSPDLFFNLSVLQTFLNGPMVDCILVITADLTADFLSVVVGNIHLATGAF